MALPRLLSLSREGYLARLTRPTRNKEEGYSARPPPLSHNKEEDCSALQQPRSHSREEDFSVIRTRALRFLRSSRRVGCSVALQRLRRPVGDCSVLRSLNSRVGFSGLTRSRSNSRVVVCFKTSSSSSSLSKGVASSAASAQVRTRSHNSRTNSNRAAVCLEMRVRLQHSNNRISSQEACSCRAKDPFFRMRMLHVSFLCTRQRSRTCLCSFLNRTKARTRADRVSVLEMESSKSR